ncbi:MAG TPA: hypothetical protein VKH61_00865 [Streptosporangiaceae bacterium]|nr:hypothetical protein [Streptosporangiaceae bacterium]
MASVETALSSVARPGIFGLIWNWRYELGPPGDDDAGWPFLNRGETDRADPEEPAWSGGLGNHGPFG